MGKRSRIHRENVIKGIEPPYGGPPIPRVVSVEPEEMNKYFPLTGYPKDVKIILRIPDHPIIILTREEAEEYIAQREKEKNDEQKPI
jgi:hypothetical protein